MEHSSNELSFKRLGVHTQNEHFVYMREDCHVCVSEGFEAFTRVQITYRHKAIVANLNVVRTNILAIGEASLSENAIHELGIEEGEYLRISHLQPIASVAHLRAKIYGNRLTLPQFEEIIKDMVHGDYSNIHLSAFITACAGDRMNSQEIASLTKAMLHSGQQIHWDAEMVVDKHCIGGLPGNRTTPIIVAIVTAFGLVMPKTSSRAITSPAGTADTMEVMTTVNLSMEKIKEVVLKEGGCIAWGGTSKMSPADDLLIKVEKALDIDSEGQLIASVLSKKAAAGSNHVIIDMPVGETAKLRSKEAAEKLSAEMEKVATAIGLKLRVMITDGSQPVGRGIGPSLEARDILSVLRGHVDAPNDLKERALSLAGELLELSGKVKVGEGNRTARELLESGKAYTKFKAICIDQGGFKEPEIARYQHEVKASSAGVISKIDNRKLAKVAKLSGAPSDKAAGIDFLSPIGRNVNKGDTLYVIHAQSKGQLEYALEYERSQENIIAFDSEFNKK